MIETVRQYYERPTDRVIKAIRFHTPSLNLGRFRGFDTGLVELSAFAESISVIRLTFTVKIPNYSVSETTPMLPLNRLVKWDWYRSLVPLRSEPFPKHHTRSLDHVEGLVEDEDSSGETDEDESTISGINLAKRSSSRRDVALAYEALDRGTPMIEIRKMLNMKVSTLKRIKRAYTEGKSIADAQQSRYAMNLLRFDEYGEKCISIPLDEVAQVESLLRESIHYRQVAQMFDLCARDLKLLGIDPESSPVTSAEGIDDTETVSKLEKLLSSE